MSAQPGSVDPQHADHPDACPHWCALQGDDQEFHEHAEGVHVSGTFLIKRTALRLASSIDPDTGAPDGPHVYVGEEEYTLYQAEVLIDALTHLVDEGTGRTQVTDQGTNGPAKTSPTSASDSNTVPETPSRPCHQGRHVP